MPQHKNFFETLQEARMRLRNTVVMYDGQPYFVHCICDHTDGIFRIYMSLLEGRDPYGGFTSIPALNDYGYDHPSLAKKIDDWMTAQGSACKIIRKMMNSPLFNKFRPFPLGMCNTGNSVVYIERQPTRKTEQGLTQSMLHETPIHCNPFSDKPRLSRVDMLSDAFRDCITASHPTAQETLDNLLDPTIQNEAVAFHRMFAFVRGPMDTIFLAYKGDIVGVIPNNDLSVVKLGRRYCHTKEVVAALGIFGTITQ